ncbi:hypothetical protein [Acuticoccus sp. I52.16.1]|uniref:hypothetical protein n=1 Tax=Acuticoccus sp. I52.16.1 TaxID=2928472 RepID=UPI001FD1D1F0|nr:hypothetical protein [Acuticoccus sp. I52.16.1]UOM36360.1 hypothetical protein MRB58_09285 [Acuticoccus sp. I52.16.1]
MRTLTVTVAAAFLAAALSPAAADPDDADPKIKSWVGGRPVWQQYSGYPAPDPALSTDAYHIDQYGNKIPNDAGFSLFGPLGANLFGNTAGPVIRSLIPSQRYDGPAGPRVNSAPR